VEVKERELRRKDVEGSDGGESVKGDSETDIRNNETGREMGRSREWEGKK